MAAQWSITYLMILHCAIAQDRIGNITEETFIESIDSLPIPNSALRIDGFGKKIPIRHEYMAKVNDSVWYSADWTWSYVQKTIDGGLTWDTVLSEVLEPNFEETANL